MNEDLISSLKVYEQKIGAARTEVDKYKVRVDQVLHDMEEMTA